MPQFLKERRFSHFIFIFWGALLIFLIFASARPARAEAFFAPGVGLRAVGAGGAFVTLADDLTAAYWNPAGLSQLSSAARFTMSLPFPNSESLFSTQYYGASFNLGILGVSALLANKTYLKDSHGETRGLWQLGIGAQISSTFRAGLGLKRYARTINNESLQGYGFDLGAMIEPFPVGLLSHLTIGVKMMDIGGIVLKNKNSSAHYDIDMRISLGAMFHWYEKRLRFLGALDIVQHKGVDGIFLGVEGVLYEAFAARLGWSNGEATWGVSFGMNNLFRVDFMTVSNGFTVATELMLFARKEK